MVPPYWVWRVRRRKERSIRRPADGDGMVPVRVLPQVYYFQLGARQNILTCVQFALDVEV